MEHSHQQQDQYDNFFSDGIDWASIPLPDARPNQLVVEDARNIDDTENTNLGGVAIASSESITPSTALRSRIENGVVGLGLDGSPTMGGMKISSVGIDVGVESGGTKDGAAKCTVGDGIGDGNAVYVSRSITGLDGRAGQQSPFSSQKELRNRLEDLQNILAQKDAALFDLESTVVALEAETSSRIRKSEHDSANKVRAAEDELRRMQQELDSKNLALAKSRKRRKEEERQKQHDQKQRRQNNGNIADDGISAEIEIHSNATPWRSPLEKHRQPQSVEIGATPNSAARMPAAPPPLPHRTDTTSSRNISAAIAPSTPASMIATIPTSIAERDAMLLETIPSSFQTSHRTKSTALCAANVRTQQLAAHLLFHCNNANTGTTPRIPESVSADSPPHHFNNNSSFIDPGVKPVDASSSHCSQSYSQQQQQQQQQQHQDVLREWDEFKRDKCRIQTILESMAIPSPLQILSIARTMEKESISETEMSKGAGIDKISQVFGMEHFARELICMFVANFSPHLMTESAPVVVLVDRGDSDTNDAVSHSDLPTDDSKEQCSSIPVMPHSQHHRGTVPWLSVELILSMLHQICSLSAEARSCVRRWICQIQNCSNSNPPTVKSVHNTTGDNINHRYTPSKKKEKKMNGGDDLMSSFTNPHHVLNRIRGISSKQSKSRIVSATLNMKDVFATGSDIIVGGENVDSLRDGSGIIWDAQHRNMVCKKFVQIVASLIIGKNKGLWGETFSSSLPSSLERQKIPTLVQMKSMALLHVWLNGCPPEKDDAGYLPPPCVYQERNIWTLFMEYLMLPWSAKLRSFIHECDNNDKFGSSNFHWIDLISVIEIQSTIPGTHPVGRRLYLQWTEGEGDVPEEGREKNSRKQDPDSKIMQNETSQNMSADAVPSNDSSDMSTKSSAIQILISLIGSSSRARHLLFNDTLYCENPNFRKGVTGARRIVASILDDLQGFIIPYLSKFSKLLRNDGCSDDERALMESVLFLCINETRIITILCETTTCESLSCYVLMRTLMKVRSVGEEGSDMAAENGDSEAGIAIMVDILECCVRVIIYNDRDAETGKSEISYLWTSIVNSTLSFLHLVSCHTQEYESNVHAESKDKADHTSFTSIISGVNRINALCSSCIMIVDSEVIAGYCCFEDGALNQARLILHDLIEVD